VTEAASLYLKVNDRDVVKASKNVDALGRKGKQTERATDGLTSSFKRMVGPLVATAGAVAALTKLVSVNRQFGILNASLITATGSAQGAKVAFGALEDFAANTPYDLAQVTDSFTKLVNYGLTPSERALTSYGNTASAMGKDLNQMVEAVADAVTGEFERLKEFGIKSSKQGDEVAFTFRGITTTVKNNSQEIEGYLTKMGENNFGDAMANRMKTLDGAISNLGDTYDALFRQIGDSGATDLMIDGIKTATEGIATLTLLLQSDVIPNTLRSWSIGFDGWGDDTVETLNIVEETFNSFFDTIGSDGVTVSTGLSLAFGSTLINIRSLIQITTIEIASYYDKLAVEVEESTASLAGGAFWILNELGLGEKLVAQQLLKTWQDVYAGPNGLLKKIDNINAARLDSLGAIVKENKASTNALHEQIALTESSTSSFGDLLDARKAAAEFVGPPEPFVGPPTPDALGQFGVGAGKNTKAETGPTASEGRAFAQLQKSLLNEEEAIAESYYRRKEIIDLNTVGGSEQRNALMSRLDAETIEASKANLQATKDEQMGFWDQYLATMEEKLSTLDDLATGTIGNFSSGVGNAFEQMVFDAQTAEEAIKGLAEGMARSTVNALGKMGAEWLAYQAIQLLIGKSTAATGAASLLANAEALSVTAGIASFASTAAIPVVGPALAPGAMATALAVTQPMAIAVGVAAGAGAAAYDNGGFIPAGNMGIVGEVGPELVQGPMRVTGRKKTSELLGKGNSGGSGMIINVTNVYEIQTGVAGTVQAEMQKIIPVLTNMTTQAILSEVNKGGTLSRSVGRR
jgi:hypothetical protein